MRDSNSGEVYGQPVIAQIIYWVSVWLLAFDGVWIAFNLALGLPDGLQGMFRLVSFHAMLGAIGAVICLSPLLSRTNSTLRVSATVLFWAVFWTLILSSHMMPPENCARPEGFGDACKQLRIVALVVAVPVSLMYCSAIAYLSSMFYQSLFFSQEKINRHR